MQAYQQEATLREISKRINNLKSSTKDRDGSRLLFLFIED